MGIHAVQLPAIYFFVWLLSAGKVSSSTKAVRHSQRGQTNGEARDVAAYTCTPHSGINTF